MPTPSSGRDSRRSSKSGTSGREAQKSSNEGKEKAKSSQIYDAHRRGSRQAESALRIVEERPAKGRTNSAPLIEPRIAESDGRNGAQDKERSVPKNKTSSSSSVPRAGAASNTQDDDEKAGVAGRVGAVRHFQPFQTPEVHSYYFGTL